MPEPGDSVDFTDNGGKDGEKNRLKTTISNLYNNLVNVTVVTGVGDLGIELGTKGGNDKIHVTVPELSRSIPIFVTQFDLVEGDIVTTLPVEYAEHQTVQELHERNVAMATRVLPENITALVNAGREVLRLFDA